MNELFFQSNAVKALGTNVDGFEVLQKLVLSLISSSLLPSVSWTGRGKGIERKIALCHFLHIRNFLTKIVCKADKSYNEDKIVRKLTYTILKRAPSKFGKSKKVPSKIGSEKTSER